MYSIFCLLRSSEQRKRKQALVAVIFFLIVGGLGFLIYRGVRPPSLTPTPNPTINLAPIQVIDRWLLNVENNDYDFLARVRNPNQSHGSPAVNYELKFFDAAGQVIFTKIGSFYILPGQTEYVADLPIRLERPAVRHEFNIKNIDWVKLDQFTLTDLDLIAGEIDYSEPTGQPFFARVAGAITNDSDFDLNRVDSVIVITGQSGEPIAVNKTSINTFLARTKRGFEVRWTRPFVGNYISSEVEVHTNILDNLNYIRRFGEQERFQQFY